jgi:hypothetical protein
MWLCRGAKGDFPKSLAMLSIVKSILRIAEGPFYGVVSNYATLDFEKKFLIANLRPPFLIVRPSSSAPDPSLPPVVANF